jgi:hypothetical protein
MPRATASSGELIATHRPLRMISPVSAGVGRREPEEHAREFRTPGADESGETDDLAGANVERDVFHAAGGAADTLERKHNWTGFASDGREDGRDLAPDHELDEFGFGE